MIRFSRPLSLDSECSQLLEQPVGPLPFLLGPSAPVGMIAPLASHLAA